MGDSPRKQSTEAIGTYVDPNYNRNQSMADQSSDIFYGGNSTQRYPTGRDDPGNAQQSEGGMYPGDQSDSPNQYGFYNPPTSDGQLQGKDRAHEIYRWGVQVGASPEQMLAKGGEYDKGYLQQLIQQGGGNDSIAFKGWQPRPNNVPAYFINEGGRWVNPSTGDSNGAEGYGGGSSGGYGSGFPGLPGATFGDYGNIQGQFQQFADTGGFSPEDLANIRARAVSPIRSAYSSANREVDRQRALQGDYAPNQGALKAKLAREQSYATSDASQNVEGMIAQMVQRGKLAGLGGMASLYGATPGLANTFGNQALQASQLASQTGINAARLHQGAQQQPNAFDQGVGYVSDIGSTIYPWTRD